MPLSIALALLASVVLVACGADDADTGGGASGAPNEAERASAAEEPNSDRERSEGGAGERGGSEDGITIAIGDSQFGEILFDSDQRAIYVFDKESSPESECY